MSRPSLHDAVEFEIVQNRLRTIAQEMGVSVSRSAHSQAIKESLDFSTALLTGSGELVVEDSRIPIQICSIRAALRETLLDFPPDAMERGDVYLCSDPYRGGIHAPDFIVMTPIFGDAGVLFFAACCAHVSDVGASSAGGLPGDASEVYEEGLRIPPLPLRRAGDPDPALYALISTNSRSPDATLGDLDALIAANNTGADRVARLVKEMGEAKVLRIVEEGKEYAAWRLREAAGSLRDGRFSAALRVATPAVSAGWVEVSTTLTVGEAGLCVDLTGTSEQVKAPINAAISQATAGVMYAFKSAFDPDLSLNEGVFGLIELVLPRGTLVNPRPPAPVNSRTDVILAIVEGLFDCFAQAGAIDPCAGSSLPHVWSFGIEDSANGDDSQLVHVQVDVGGGGARRGASGWDATASHVFNGMNTPVEALETEYPVRVLSYELIPDSGGRGEHRGGMGVRRDVEFLSEAVVSVRAGRVSHPPQGVAGGGAGRPGGWWVRRGDDLEALPEKISNVEFAPGDVLVIETSGGGGWGTVDDG
jgi:N-methylhydantoinase B